MKPEFVLKNSGIALTLMCGAMLALTGCSDKKEVQPPSSIGSAPRPVVVQPASGVVSNAETHQNSEVEMPEAAKKNNCTACHSIDKKIVGPAWMNVSVKYKDASKFEYNGKEYPLIEGLMMKVSLGGSGHWGSMPMPPNDSKGVKQAEIRQLVQFVLGLAK